MNYFPVRLPSPAAFIAATCFLSSIAPAGQILDSSARISAPAASPVSDTRYGFFGLLDRRSAYGEDIFPEPFLVDESDLEDNEVRLNWLRTRSRDFHTDAIKGEFEKGVGPVTLELEAPFERNRGAGGTIEGFDNLSIAVRAPLFQHVSPNGFIDTTFGAGFEGGIPVHSTVSKNGEIVPKIFSDLSFGRRFTIQTVLGYSRLVGQHPDGGLENFEYGFVFGYGIEHKELPLPGVLRLTPIFEMKGETQLNRDNAGHNALQGTAGIRANLKPMAGIQSRIGLGYVYPMDSGGRENFQRGFILSMIFEY